MSSPATSSRVLAESVVPNAVRALRRIHVGSVNSSKIQAVRDALAAFVPDLEVDGVEVETGVPEQPVGFGEILRGAKNRAEAALAPGGCDLAVGIEDGLVTLSDVEDVAGLASSTLNLGCAWLTDGRRESFGLTSAFGYPQACTEVALRERQPIGDLFDELWRTREASAMARGVGNIGKLTLGVLPRAEYARHAVVCAFARYLHEDLYFVRDAVREPVRETDCEPDSGTRA